MTYIAKGNFIDQMEVLYKLRANNDDIDDTGYVPSEDIFITNYEEVQRWNETFSDEHGWKPLPDRITRPTLRSLCGAGWSFELDDSGGWTAVRPEDERWEEEQHWDYDRPLDD